MLELHNQMIRYVILQRSVCVLCVHVHMLIDLIFVFTTQFTFTYEQITLGHT